MATLRLFLVNMTYPSHRVATQPGCVKTAWKYRWVGRLPVVAENAGRAAEMVLAHLSECMAKVLEKHAASCRIYVSEHHLSRTPGIKFSVNGNPDSKYRVRACETGYWPEYIDELAG